MKRFRFKRDKALGEQLIKEARLTREKAEQLPTGGERLDLLKKAADIDEWLKSPGLQPPKR